MFLYVFFSFFFNSPKCITNSLLVFDDFGYRNIMQTASLFIRILGNRNTISDWNAYEKHRDIIVDNSHGILFVFRCDWNTSIMLITQDA